VVIRLLWGKLIQIIERRRGNTLYLNYLPQEWASYQLGPIPIFTLIGTFKGRGLSISFFTNFETSSISSWGTSNRS